MLPKLNEFLHGRCAWSGAHQDINYEITWHGFHPEYMKDGIYCAYLHLNQDQFQPEDWKKLRLKRTVQKFFGRFHEHFNYEKFPDLGEHGGWTFGEVTKYVQPQTGQRMEHIKIGVDYAHGMDRDTHISKSSVEDDIKKVIDELVKLFPKRRLRCGYDGTYNEPEDMYVAINGQNVCKRHIEALVKDNMVAWLPKEGVSV